MVDPDIYEENLEGARRILNITIFMKSKFM